MLKIICVTLLTACLVLAVISILLLIFFPNSRVCKETISTATRFNVKQTIYSGDLIFEEHFDKLDKNLWKPEVTLSGGYNGEFQWYVADDENSYAENGHLYIKPTLTASKIGNYQVEHGFVRLENCTDPDPKNCNRQAGENTIIHPIRSARLNTAESFSFKYGRVEVIAKMPQGDWLWPAVWLMPTQRQYGGWPRSGEIDLLESRGNKKYSVDGGQIGVEQVTSTLHFGPRWDQDAYKTATYSKNNQSGYNNDFHKYAFVWNEHGIRFFVDDVDIGFVSVDDGFWQRGHFEGDNIWSEGTKMAPFDQEFHFIINLAVGGTIAYFPDGQNQNGRKPWNDTSETAMKDFWVMRNQWLPSWQLNTNQCALVVDSVRVWAF